jgi:hypothetical protein
VRAFKSMIVAVRGWNLRSGPPASGDPFTVRALAYIAAGHVAHHMAVIQDRYT